MARIYISSTYSDLEAFRERVYRALRQTGHEVIAMEDYVATDQRPLQKCIEDVAGCDLYVGIFAWKYGYVPPHSNPEEKSITELEFRRAKESRINCLLFLHDEKASWSPSQMDTNLDRIRSLRDELCRDFTVSFFTDQENLAALVSAAVIQWEKKEVTKVVSGSGASNEIAALNVLKEFIEQPHWSQYVPIQFSITNLSDSIIKLTQLVLHILEREEINKVALKKGGAPLSEFKLFAEISQDDELDLLRDVEAQFVLNAGTSDAFNLALAGSEGYKFKCQLRAGIEVLAARKRSLIESAPFVVQYPIRTLGVLQQRRVQS